MTYVLSLIGDRTHIITRDQYEKISGYIEAGFPKSFRIGESLIVVNQITGIDPMATYKRQMKTKLAARDLRMCDRCATILPRMDKCPCKERPEKYPDILEQARLENPALAQQLDQLAASKSIPQLTHE